MKKLMIAAAVAFAAVASQAGSVSWTIMNIYDGNASDKASGQAYMFDSAKVSTSAVVTGLQNAWRNGYTGLDTTVYDAGKTAMLAYLNDNALGKAGTAYTWTGSAGTYSKSSGLPTNQDLGLAGGTSYTLYAVMFDDLVGSFSDDSKFYVGATKSGQTKSDDSSSAVAFAWATTLSADSKVAGNWNQLGDVPEPTSGLLLLLGVAGLALRRRHA